MYFDHEKLSVYQRSLEFIEFIEPILQRFKYRISVIEHLDEASTSVSLNIAEGTGNLALELALALQWVTWNERNNFKYLFNN